MARLPKEKLLLLKDAFIRKAMLPGDAAKPVGTTYATANRYPDVPRRTSVKIAGDAALKSLEAAIGRACI